MQTRRLFARFLPVVAGVLLAWSLPAGAGILEPGELNEGEENLLNLDDPSFAGTELASRTLPFETSHLDPLMTPAEPRTVTGTLTQRVIRESATGALAFHYEVTGDVDGPFGVDFENLSVGDFRGFTTDVFSNETDLSTGGAQRSSDGRIVTFTGDESWGAYFVVRTNATAFDEGGTAVIDVTFLPTGPVRDLPFDAFRPTLQDDGAGEPNPIPLPPAAWAALATMGASGALKGLRRLVRTRSRG